MNFRVLTRRVELTSTPVDTFAALSDDGKAEGHFLLETADSQRPGSGVSRIATSPCVRVVGHRDHVVLDALTENGAALLHAVAGRFAESSRWHGERQLRIAFVRDHRASDERARLQEASPFDALRALLECAAPASAEDLHHLMLVGVFGFETVELFERFAPFPGAEAPLFVLYVPELVVRIPRQGHAATISAVVFFGPRSAHAENELGQRLAGLATRLSSLTPSSPVAPAVEKPTFATYPDDAEFIAKVERAKEHLRAGDAFQIVLSRRFEMPCSAELAAYRVLRVQNPSPYMFYARCHDFTLFGASPESAVKIDASARAVEICPIAGTRARGLTADGAIDLDLDSRIEAELRGDRKEIAEHMMLVDLARNDVARISRPGTRQVRQLLTVERYSRVMHLVSRVSGELREGVDALRAFSALLPMGTLSGAPKIRAIEIIRQLEGRPRESYGGAVGYVDAAGNMDTAIVIRAAVVRAGRALVQAGAGVVLLSDPLAEADETRRKAESVLRAIAGANSARVTRAA